MAVLWPLTAWSCAGGPPVALRLLPPAPAAELAPGPPRYHVLLEVRTFPPEAGVCVDGTPVAAGQSLLLPRTVAGAVPELPVVVTAGGREWRLVLPLHPEVERIGAAVPDLVAPFLGPCQVLGSFHAPTHVVPGRRHAVDLLPDSLDAPVLAPCAAVVVARTVDRPEGNAEGNELHLRRPDGLVVVLSHLAPGTTLPAVGDTVVAGQQVGRIGTTGHTTGPHLHLEVRGHDGDTVPFRIGGRVPVRGDH